MGLHTATADELWEAIRSQWEELKADRNLVPALYDTLPRRIFADARPAQPPRKQPLAAPSIQVPDVNFSKTSGTTQTTERESLPHDKPPTVSEPALEAMEVTTGTPESVTLRDSPKARRKSQDRLKPQKKHPPVMPPATDDDT
ncbi:hypothetical protein HPB50_010328 [Hyalomma asiaticum]|uniref:Uncharacterized protein n=1 Tax=Hyalomma asiaticum TaxID=266040 RepID=A0ACB7SU95_HYAAI|nr:hypothetical protein HPB50_010328 [Hyalomma asiaticum]